MNSLIEGIIPDRPISRLICGVLVGIIFGAYIYNTIDRGVCFYFAPKDTFQWNKIFWDDWLLRIIGIIISSGAGSVVAGLIARRKGKIVGIISVIPSVLFWLYCLYCLFNNQLNLNISQYDLMPASTSPVLIFLAIIINGIIGYFGGNYGEKLSIDISFIFDNRKNSLLGIKWYNYFWYPIIMYFILIEGFYIASYAYETAKILFTLPTYNLSSIAINLLSFPALIGLLLLNISVIGSYSIITNNQEFIETTKWKIISFVLIIFVVPPVAYGLTLLSFYLRVRFKK